LPMTFGGGYSVITRLMQDAGSNYSGAIYSSNCLGLMRFIDFYRLLSFALVAAPFP
jgi:hypothetical protein